MKRLLLIVFILSGCVGKNKTPTRETINAIDLKRGKVVLCGPSEKQFGKVLFETSCSPKVQKDVDLAIALLHSFEYDEAEKVFAKVIDEEPRCAMAYWGVAMCNYHPLWAPPLPAELEKGAKAIAIAQSIKSKTARETAYIEAIAKFYHHWDKTDHPTRFRNFEEAMEKNYLNYPNDKEAAIFYALALTGAADPADRSFIKQKKASAILTALQSKAPDHPGIIHYIIHANDYPALAAIALPAARKYATIAPASAHAQHMPSHIFTRLGLWDECIYSNRVSTAAAKCYAENTGIKGHWDEELHGMDYLVYAYLQKGDNKQAHEQCEYLKTIDEVWPANFKVAYAFAAIPARYFLENKMWEEAAALPIHPLNFPWEKFPWQKAIIHFTRVLGAANTGQIDLARAELKNLTVIHDTLVEQRDPYKANQVQIQIKTAEAWIFFKEGKNNEALEAMNTAANMEDYTQKHPVTPGEVIPARELLGDMLLQMNKPAIALIAYEATLKEHPNRFNSLYGAGIAAKKLGDKEKANTYHQQLITIATNTDRPELEIAKLSLKK
ncbi:tetratricopeptide repeat protein [Chitinophaga sp. SYP-B3965]|uniref:tetratricopeptide repeat protein n=1 Tax=Chitinophaga sp. SYP-B3965 TaxID=2663120 RepID=UPI001299B6B0|nr:tetratricopeptide repeat protein [Chitinophaga sp. SYP-B3965]MRG46900.1 tetratricopeptide repeat protein [Chitinophaga sp. SYP-B3965]